MNRFNLKRFGAKILATALTISTAHAMAGGSNGGGGFEFPNSHLVLKKVTKALIQDIDFTNEGVFANFSGGLNSKAEILRVLSNIVEAPREIRTRLNGHGEEEGLMFDYDRDSNSIFVMRPFFSSYASLAMRRVPQNIPWRKLAYDSYKNEMADVREKLVHELAHLMKIGVKQGGTDDGQADVFAARFESALEHQLIYCDSKHWVKNETGGESHLFNVVVHPVTGYFVLIDGSTKSKSEEEVKRFTQRARSSVIRSATDTYLRASVSAEDINAVSPVGTTEFSASGNKYSWGALDNNTIHSYYHGDLLHLPFNITIDRDSGRGLFKAHLKDANGNAGPAVEVPLGRCRWKIAPIEIEDLVTR